MSDTLDITEHHPAADNAYRWLKGFMVEHQSVYLFIKLSLTNMALSGNRQAEVCVGTINRLAAGEPVSDRYLLGLAWTVMYMSKFEEMEETIAHRFDLANPPTDREIQGGIDGTENPQSDS